MAVSEESLSIIKKKVKGLVLSEEEYSVILDDISHDKLSPVEISAFFTAIAVNGLDLSETTSVTRALVNNGTQVEFGKKPVVDKHSIGGVPGNEVSIIIVPIIAAAGLTIPKTATHAITSPCGTLDVMELFCDVELNAEEMKRVVNETNGCIVCGSSVGLAPAMDKIIGAVGGLRMDPHQLMVASILAKKKALGVDYLLMDLPTGKEAKAKDTKEAEHLAIDFTRIGHNLGIQVECAITPGDKPVGRKIGPALEAISLLKTVKGEIIGEKAHKATALAGVLLEVTGKCKKGEGSQAAMDMIKNGKAYKKLVEIVRAQGGDEKRFGEIQLGQFKEDIFADEDGIVYGFDNGVLTSIARAAGTPQHKGAGIELQVRRGISVKKGQKLMTIYSESESMLDAALEVANFRDSVLLEKVLLKIVKPTFELQSGGDAGAIGKD